MMMAEITVRPATLDDAEFVVRGNAEMARETENLTLDIERLRAGIRAMFETPSRGFYLIAELGGIRAGQMMITYEWSDWRNGVFWWIQSVYTAPEMRRRGVFRALYAHAESLAHTESLAHKDGSVCGLRLYVESNNQAAQETYRRCGMRETDYRMFEVDHILTRH
jgi:ribosomal protein S18 acetylase RimI-like enzyme